MKLPEEAKTLIRRYLQAVSAGLPHAKRHDISEEIKSGILDYLEKQKPETDDEAVSCVKDELRRLGDPKLLALGYNPERGIVKPQLMPVYRMVLMIELLVIAAAGLAGLLMDFHTFDPQEALNAFAGFLSGLLSAFGAVTIIFWIISHFSTDEEVQDKSWDIDGLPELKYEEDIVKLPNEIISLLVLVAVIVIFNFRSDLIAIYSFKSGGGFLKQSFLGTGFKSLLVFLNIRWTAGAVYHSALLIRRQKAAFLLIYEIALNAADLSILWLIGSRGMDFYLNTEAVKNTGLERLADGGSYLFYGIIILIAALTVWDTIKLVSKFLRKPLNGDWEL